MDRLQEIGPGSLKVYVSEPTGDAMKAITDDLDWFGLTALFPWTVEMLGFIRSNCAMLDATFRMLKPYVLESRNLISANNSTPIALGGSQLKPSAHRGCYIHMWT
jgi:hypothetical protein